MRKLETADLYGRRYRIAAVLRFGNARRVCFQNGTPDEICHALADAIESGHRVRLFYGDAETGRDWCETSGTNGKVGLTTGSVQIPILVANARAMGGPAILTGCLVKIVDLATRTVVYQHPLYTPPALHRVHASNWPDSPADRGQLVIRDDTEIIAHFTNTYCGESAERFIDFLTGKRMAP